MAPDRASGEAVWRYAAEGREGGWGLAGSPAVGAGRLFVTGLDGRVGAVHQ